MTPDQTKKMIRQLQETGEKWQKSANGQERSLAGFATVIANIADGLSAWIDAIEKRLPPPSAT